MDARVVQEFGQVSGKVTNAIVVSEGVVAAWLLHIAVGVDVQRSVEEQRQFSGPAVVGCNSGSTKRIS